MSHETEPQLSIEAQVLTRLGYADKLDVPLDPDQSVTGRNFLDLYNDPQKRQGTEDILHGFMDMTESDADYEATETYVRRFVEPIYGSPQQQ